MSDSVLITGAGRGLGLAMARRFLEKGWQVFASARHPGQSAGLAQLQEEASSLPGELILVTLDVLDDDSVQAAAREVASRTDRLEVLINNAGVHPERGDETFEELDLEGFQTAFATNVMGAARCCRAFGPLLQKAARPRIVNVSSGSGSISDRDNHRRYCYGASKAALNHFTRSLAHDWKDRGVAVVAISPGWVKTDMGGPEAPLEIDEAVGSMVETVRELGIDRTGTFLDREGTEGTYAW